MDNAIVLLSGGLDSATCLAIAKDKNFKCYALSFNYGQRHNIELDCAKQNAKNANVADHIIIDIDLRQWGGSALTSNHIDVPDADINSSEIPTTYVPARNTIFLSFATAWAEVLNCKDIFIGVNSVDYSGYPDCRPEFIKSFEKTATLGTKAHDEGWKFNIHTPLQKLNKSEIITLGTKLGVDYSLTHSCYNPNKDGLACGKCDSCELRKKGFQQANIKDPTSYQLAVSS